MPIKEIEDDMPKGVIWSPQHAIDSTMVHEIKEKLFEKGEEVISIAD
ncbi:MAG: hypothetical protein NWF08_05560 [Candidatus Bathyarchaeota archaeon]|nr:hypothetical protein [Candidatus Bathyarchaeota archaeon]